jgi:DNA-3-methyladenine glycosylase
MRLKRSFYMRDVLDVAPDILGKNLVRKFKDGHLEKKTITEVEAYKGEDDQAAHSRFGKTKRNRVMYARGGLVYVYLIYGMYWMLNIVTGHSDHPQAVLIRGVEGINGPGRVGKWLGLDKSFYGLDLTESNTLWLEGDSKVEKSDIKRTPRVGVDYAGDWKDKNWRFILNTSRGKG